MDNLTSVCFFFENSPKQQKFFEYFIEYYKDELKLLDTKRKHILGLSKTRRFERHHAYDMCYLLLKTAIHTFESICNYSFI